VSASLSLPAEPPLLRTAALAATGEPVIVVDGVSYRYPERGRPDRYVAANSDISLQIARGEVFALLGHNGAGKTTLVRQLLGLLTPSKGEILVDGRRVSAAPQAVRSTVGYLPQGGLAMRWIPVKSALELTGRLRGQSVTDAKEQLQELARLFGFDHHLSDLGHTLSGGMLRLAHIAMAMMGRPSVLVLDEPTNELDPDKRRRFWDFIRELNQTTGSTVVLVTHNVLEAERVVDRAAILREGRLVACDTPARLRASAGRVVRLEVTAETNAPVLEDLKAFGLAKRGRIDDGSVSTMLPAALAAKAAGSVLELYALGDITGFQLAPPSLEDAYLSIDRSPSQRAPAFANSSFRAAAAVAPGEPALAKPFKGLQDFWLLLGEQLLEARSMWLWTVLFSVLMPLTMVFGIARVGSGLTDANSHLYIVSGAAVLAVATESILTLAQRIGSLKREGTIVHYLSLPIAAGSYTLAVVSARLLLTLPAVVVPILGGRFLYGLDIRPNLAVLVVSALMGVALSGIGLALGTLLRSLELIVMTTNLTVYVLLMVSPVFIPAQALPAPLRLLGYLLPPSYAAEALRSAMKGEFTLRFFVDIAVLSAMAIFSVAVSTRYFRRGLSSGA
jgi:ABC-2 type transport system permease protein